MKNEEKNLEKLLLQIVLWLIEYYHYSVRFSSTNTKLS